MGIAPDNYDDIKRFSEALNNPVKSKTGKTYVEIPNPERTLPIIKKGYEQGYSRYRKDQRTDEES